MSFSRITIFVVITAVAVYLGLTLILPHRKLEPTLAGGPAPDQVFNSTTSVTPSAAGDAATSPASSTASDSGAPTGEQNQAAAPASTPAAADASSSETASVDAAASSDGKSLSEAEARKIAEEVGRKVATQVAQQMMQQQSNQSAQAAPVVSDDDVRRIAQTEVDKAVDAKPDASSAAELAMTKKSVKTKPVHEAPVKSVTSKSSDSASAPAVKKSKAPATDAITAWWTPASQAGNGQLGLTFAGEAAAERAIALLFTSPFSDAASVSGQIKVLDAGGKPVSGQWMLAPNPRMLVLRVPNKGRYTVVVGAGVADSQGKTLGTALHGPVYVH